MRLELGPVLYLGKPEADTWRFHINLLLRGSTPGEVPPVRILFANDADAVVDGPIPAADFSEVNGCVWWRWSVAVPRGAERRVRYEVLATDALVENLPDEPIGDICIPARGSLPRIAFFSCNGTEQIEVLRVHPDPRALWKDILRRHEGGVPGQPHRAGYHLLVGGGDQVYADSLWHKDPLKNYQAVYREHVPHTRLTADEYLEVRRQYVELYAERWGDPEIRAVMARVPGVFTWDDHDIFDGWGSHDEDLQRAPYFQQVYEAAREAFEAFQIGGKHLNLRVGDASHFLQAVTFAEADRQLDLLLLDLRSGRTRQEVLSESQRGDLQNWLEQQCDGAAGVQRHLLVVSVIPVVHRRVYRLFRNLDVKRTRDDQIDQWEHPNHRGERARLIVNLLRHARKARCQITILSGDVHVGARGRIVTNHPELRPEDRAEGVIHQITSSAIINFAPKWYEMLALRSITDDDRDSPWDGVYTHMLDVTGDEQLLIQRNWLSAVFDEPGDSWPRVRLWMQWYTEAGGVEPQVVVEA